MLQPGMCSATRSVNITCAGPPGETITAAATAESSGGRKLCPPTPANPEYNRSPTRYLNQSSSARQSESVNAMISPVAA